MYRLSIASGLALVMMVAGVGCGKPVKKSSMVESREASTVGVKKVEIRSTTGKIDVISMRSLNPRFKVTVTKWAKAPGADKSKEALKKVQLRIHRVGDTAIVLIKHPKSSGKTTYGADLQVVLPAELDVDVDNRTGGVRVMGMTGRVEVRVAHGDIEARGISGHLKAHTKQGDLVASGDIGSFDLRADAGKVKVHVRQRDSLAEASSIRAGRGDILLTLSRSFNGQLSAEATGGKVTLPFPGIKTVGKTQAGTVGKGGKLLSLHADAGSILVLARTYSRMRLMPTSGANGSRVYREMHMGRGHGMHRHGMQGRGRSPGQHGREELQRILRQRAMQPGGTRPTPAPAMTP